MINEGIIVNDTAANLRTEMLRKIHLLGEVTAHDWERAVFESLTGSSREDVDWDFEDNQAGYFTWLKSFDRFAAELIEDGFVRIFERDGMHLFAATETDPAIDWTPLVSRPR